MWTGQRGESLVMNKNVMVIPARKNTALPVTETENPKLKVAAYCRVSTDSEEQATSYETQVEHYTNFIKNNFAFLVSLSFKSTLSLKNFIPIKSFISFTSSFRVLFSFAIASKINKFA